ncbi:MAG: molybdopterin-synthase adenylyltransferase MoeB [Cyclobacteriaceae bacterium]|nr:molybdopterin-synthase adenylyltransferase MoeB [Cyclobacteriaceae bacterium]
MSKVIDFNKKELERYSRHFVLPQFGIEGQQKLKAASVIVIGAGGLGCPVLQYLVAAGVGTIGILDFDIVGESNLQRQVLYGVDDIGKPKAQQAAEKLKALNPYIKIEIINNKIDSANALELLGPFDIIVDCTDNFPTRYLLNDASVLLDKPLVYGSIFRYEGQVAVFNLNRSASYRDLYQAPPSPGSVPNCEEGGVLGVLPGIIGCLQANEVLKIIAGIGEPLINKVLLIDTLSMDINVIKFPNRNERNSIKKLIDYESFCGINNTTKEMDMKEVTVNELKALKENGADFQLIDVREEYECEICSINGEHIPIGNIPESIEKISRNKKVIIHCRSGSRSGNTIKWLEKNYHFDNLYNLKGGIIAWAEEIDTSLTKY